MAGYIIRTGGCLCGAVRYKTIGEPFKSGLCHCADCRKVTGSSFLAYADWLPEKFSFTGDSRPSTADHFARNADLACSACGPISRRCIWGLWTTPPGELLRLSRDGSSAANTGCLHFRAFPNIARIFLNSPSPGSEKRGWAIFTNWNCASHLPLVCMGL
jgi:hypothetical protein